MHRCTNLIRPRKPAQAWGRTRTSHIACVFSSTQLNAKHPPIGLRPSHSSLFRLRAGRQVLVLSATLRNTEPEEATAGDGTPTPAPESNAGSADTAIASLATWVVPWGGWLVAQAMLQLWLFMLPLGFGAVQLGAELRGVPVTALTDFDKATSVLAAEAAQLVIVPWVLKSTLSEHAPLPAPWFEYRFDGRAVGIAIVAAAGALGTAALGGLAIGQNAAAPERTAAVAGLIRSGGVGVALPLAAASVMLAPAIEEYVYRGFLLPSFSKWMPLPVAVAATSAVFAAAHLSPGEFLPLASLGCWTGAAAVAARGNLAAPTLAHALYNATVFEAVWAAAAGE